MATNVCSRVKGRAVCASQAQRAGFPSAENRLFITQRKFALKTGLRVRLANFLFMFYKDLMGEHFTI